jgi:hypothetical protein
MGTAKMTKDETGLLVFLRELVDDHSLDEPEDRLARKALESGLRGLSSEERAGLDQTVIQPYLTDCEGCGGTPGWREVLAVYDTGLCAGCFDRLAGVDTLGVRPDWMPLALPEELDDDDLPDGQDACPAAESLPETAAAAAM